MDTILDDIDVGQNLLKSKNFKWLCGMKTSCGVRLKAGWQLDKWIHQFNYDDSPVPDINDPATKGCLLSIVRSLSKDKECYVCRFDEGWSVVEWPESKQSYHRSEGVALSAYIYR